MTLEDNLQIIVFVPFSKFFDFHDPTSEHHISVYNHRRNAKLGLIEWYGNTEQHAKRTINLVKTSWRYLSSKRLCFL